MERLQEIWRTLGTARNRCFWGGKFSFTVKHTKLDLRLYSIWYNHEDNSTLLINYLKFLDVLHGLGYGMCRSNDHRHQDALYQGRG